MQTIKIDWAGDCSSEFKPTITTGAGPGAERALGWEAMSIRHALASAAQPDGPLLSACQAAQDLAIVQRSARKLQMRMAADGRDVSQTSMEEARAAALHALVCWRGGCSLVRAEDGADVPTLVRVEYGHAATIAWRALVDSLSDRGIGQTIPLLGGAEDDWLCAQSLPSESRTERAARLLIERRTAANQARLTRHLDEASHGRGRRAEVVQRVRNACALLMSGLSLEQAASECGFKSRGRNSATSTLVRAVKRLGLAEGFALLYRATPPESHAGLAAVVPDVVRPYVPSRGLPTDYLMPFSAGEVLDVHHLSRASSGLPLDVTGSTPRRLSPVSRRATLASAADWARARALRGIVRHP